MLRTLGQAVLYQVVVQSMYVNHIILDVGGTFICTQFCLNHQCSYFRLFHEQYMYFRIMHYNVHSMSLKSCEQIWVLCSVVMK